MKTVAVIRRVHNQPAILKHSPIFGSLARAKISIGRPKNRGANECNSGELQTNRIATDQTGTSNWLISVNVAICKPSRAITRFAAAVECTE
jgi:hypothetical protein